jgi:membrane protein implicated in regulation of membrane protease activity
MLRWVLFALIVAVGVFCVYVRVFQVRVWLLQRRVEKARRDDPGLEHRAQKLLEQRGRDA